MLKSVLTGTIGLALAFQISLCAAEGDLPWVYDASSRVEPAPSAQTSSVASLDAKAQDEGVAAAVWFSSAFFDDELSVGSDLNSLPTGLKIIVR